MTKLKFSNWLARSVASGFDAASRTITRIKGWTPANTEINTLIVADGDLMRARSRKLCRENPWARGAVETFVSNCVGTGIVPRSLHPDPAMRVIINSAWDRWSPQADAAGVQDFNGLLATAVRACRTDGEVFARLRFRRATDNLHVPLQIQLLEADFVPYWKMDNAASGNYTRAGITFNPIGQRNSYWMYRDHPGSDFIRDGQVYEIPASQVLHCFDVRRPGQIRGEPWMVPAIIMLYDVKQLLDAALMRNKISNLLSVWIKRLTSSSVFAKQVDKGDGTATAGIGPGTVNYLEQGEEPIFLDPHEAGGDFAAFLKAMLQALSRALNLTYEQLTGDLSSTNLSSIRHGVQEMRRWCEAFQYHVCVQQLCQPIRDAWIEQAVIAGVFGNVAGAYRKNPEIFHATRWDPPGWPWIDPETDILAAKAAVRSGFTSREAVVAGTGENIEDIDRAQAADNARADAAGLKYDSDGRNPDKGQQTAANQQQQQGDGGAAGQKGVATK